MPTNTTFSLQHALPNQLEIAYESLADLKKFGEIHPYIIEVNIIKNNLPEYLEYVIVEEVHLFGFIKNHPIYETKVFEIEEYKHIRYTSRVKKNIFLTIDITFSKNKSGNLIVTETFDIRSPKLMGMVFSGILKKAHFKFFENLKKILHNSIEELHTH